MNEPASTSRDSDASPLLRVMTAPAPGAVAILQLTGPGLPALLARLTGRTDWPAGRLRLVSLGGIDEGLAVLLREDWAQLMPHGGPRVVQLLAARLMELGARPETGDGAAIDARTTYPEARSAIEADMLATIASAASSGAIDLLLAQPRLWSESARPDWDQIERRTRAWDRLLVPPTVAVVGRPNVGKSTLTNRLLGRTASLVADLPGTTRDWVAGLVELDGLAVRWIDTPGLRKSDDVIEQRAIELARGVIESAEVVLALRDPHLDWPEPEALPREPDLWVMNKADLAEAGRAVADGSTRAAPLRISAQTGEGVAALQGAILARLGWSPASRAPAAWAFSPFLRSPAARDPSRLREYLAGS